MKDIRIFKVQTQLSKSNPIDTIKTNKSSERPHHRSFVPMSSVEHLSKIGNAQCDQEVLTDTRQGQLELQAEELVVHLKREKFKIKKQHFKTLHHNLSLL